MHILALGFLALAATAQALETHLPPQATELEKQFVATVQRAIATTNIAALAALDYLPALPAKAATNLFGSFYRNMIERGCICLTLERADPATATEHGDPLGENVRENLPVRWIVTVRHPPPVPGGKATTVLRAGWVNGKIRFTHVEEKK